ncbi:hypothetical protein RR48_14829 [Papilio machaon]|uniref:Uncharacterized protein n=1 Tax=Papilio machaon TaxID=76193 RepID=A0A194R1R5_PAPMA|nr:hypothetical protein RR48_14829 [Papilio machaon]
MSQNWVSDDQFGGVSCRARWLGAGVWARRAGSLGGCARGAEHSAGRVRGGALARPRRRRRVWSVTPPARLATHARARTDTKQHARDARLRRAAARTSLPRRRCSRTLHEALVPCTDPALLNLCSPISSPNAECDPRGRRGFSVPSLDALKFRVSERGERSPAAGLTALFSKYVRHDPVDRARAIKTL